MINLPPPQKIPSLRSLRESLRPHRSKADALAWTIFAVNLGAYFGLVLAVAMLPWLPLKFFASLLLGLAMGTLFVIGHDACHGSFTSRASGNRVIGRVAFLPTLHAFSLWKLGHNETHHVYTNLLSKDYVWAPFLPDSFAKLPRWRRTLERIYRSLPGVGLYYLIEIWWKRLLFPHPKYSGNRTAAHFRDSGLVLAFALAMFAGIATLSYRFHGRNHLVRAFVVETVFTFVIPFLLWNWLMGFVILLHHTHPLVPWFDDPQQWQRCAAQLTCTVHVVFPKPFGSLLLNIMEHTAHHLDVTIPLYRLPQPQRLLDDACIPAIVLHRCSLRSVTSMIRQCKLYDPRQHVWLDFEGNRTAQAVVHTEGSHV